VDFNFDYLDRERYSHSKKKLEVRKSEKLAAALSVFDSSCEVEVRGMFFRDLSCSTLVMLIQFRYR
jgi:hypothetical protein